MFGIFFFEIKILLYKFLEHLPYFCMFFISQFCDTKVVCGNLNLRCMMLHYVNSIYTDTLREFWHCEWSNSRIIAKTKFSRIISEFTVPIIFSAPKQHEAKWIPNTVVCLNFWRTEKEGIWWYLKDNFCQFFIKTCCGYSLELPYRGDSNEYPQHMFYGEISKIISLLLRNTLLICSTV